MCLLMFSDFRLEVIVLFVDVIGIVDFFFFSKGYKINVKTFDTRLKNQCTTFDISMQQYYLDICPSTRVYNQ